MIQQQYLLSEQNYDWLLILDAMRPDVFRDYIRDYLTGALQTVKSGCQQTPEWFNRMWPGKYDAMLFHGGQPIRSINGGPDYDARRHFATVPYTTLYESNELEVCPPMAVNDVVRKHLPDRLNLEQRLHALGYGPQFVGDEFDFRVVRYLQPHKPYRSVPSTASDRGADGLGDHELRLAYEDNVEWVLEGARDLVQMVEGDVVVTSDHGECLGDCGQRFHGPELDPHDELVNVPWMEVSGVA